MSRNAGVWIDHRKAQIVALNPGGRFTTVILSRVARHPGRGGDSPMKSAFEARFPAGDRRQRSLMGELNRYYDAVIEALHDYGMLLVFGPGEAKGELHARLLKMKLAARISAVESADQMTDRQIVAKVRAHFRDAAPRAPMPL